MKGLQLQKHVVQSELSESIKNWFAGSFIGFTLSTLVKESFASRNEIWL